MFLFEVCFDLSSPCPTDSGQPLTVIISTYKMSDLTWLRKHFCKIVNKITWVIFLWENDFFFLYADCGQHSTSNFIFLSWYSITERCTYVQNYVIVLCIAFLIWFSHNFGIFLFTVCNTRTSCTPKCWES